jgi:hypothetical protein
MFYKRPLPAIIALLLACANQVPPTGGPDDVKAPTVMATQPLAGSVSNPLQQKITISFSEWIDAATAEKSVSVFPPLDKGFSVEVAGKRLVIAPRTAFAESTTYHIELSAAFKDLHGNSIGTPFQYVFSTGPVLDSAAVSGCVVGRSGSAQPKAALFRHTGPTLHDTVLLKVPSYLTQTDSGGLFSFRNIRRGTYSLIAFIDANSDNRLNAGAEAAFAPLERELTVDSAVGPLELFEVVSDTAGLRIASVKALTPLTIFAEWASGTPANFRPDTARYRLVAIDSGGRAPALAGYLPLRNSHGFMLTCQDSMTNTAYGLTYTIHQRIPLPVSIHSLQDTIRFNGTTLADTITPRLLSTQPKGVTGLEPDLRLIWSKPVTSLVSACTIVDTIGDSVSATIDTTWSDTTVIIIMRRLLPDRAYSLSLPAGNFSDLGGNHPTDTTDSVVIRVAFRTMSAESLCTSLSGGGACLEPDNRRIWVYSPLRKTAPLSCADREGRFQFDSIPASRGLISYFIDVNADRTVTSGSLFPWLPPEPSHIVNDTIEARARWDIEGIEIKSCEKCPPRKRQLQDSLSSPKNTPQDSTQRSRSR